MAGHPASLLNPAPDFSTPLELLHACHGRIETQCATLLKLPDHVQQHGADTQAQQAATAILRYFSTAARHHHEDEEQDVFPWVRAHAAAAGDVHVLGLLDELQAQHRALDTAWSGLRPWLEALSRGTSLGTDAVRITAFTEAYRTHIAREEQELLPYCHAVLEAGQLARIGEHMAQRRGVKLSGDSLV